MAVRTLADIAELERTPLAERGLPPSTFAMLSASAERFGDKIAIRHLSDGLPDEPTRDVSYRQLLRRVVQAANLFRSLGVEPGSSVSMLLPLAPEAFVAMIGAQTAGLANPINFLLEAHQIASLLREAHCRVLLAPDPALVPGLWPKVEAALRDLPDAPRLLRVGGPRGADSFEAALEQHSGEALSFAREIGPGDVASLFHTGGTTALPKLARHTHGGLMLQCWVNAQLQDLRADDVWLTGVPIFHVGGANCAGLTALSQGATNVLLTPAGLRNPNVICHFWALAERFRATVIGMVPTSWGAALNTPSEGFDLSRLRLCLSGASTLPAEVARQVEQRLGRQICEGWGMTETHGYATMTPALGVAKVGAIGLRAPYTELIVASVKDGRVERLAVTGEIGRVLVRGPMVFAGYANDAHNHGAWIAAEAGADWLDTGDLGRFDEDGYVWLTGRAKDVIIRGGHNIDPVAIEEALHQHPAVEMAAAIGRPDAHAGEIPIAFVQLKPGASASPEELQAFARERVAERAAAPAEVRVLAQMPLTGVGKIFKPALREIAAKEALEQAVAGLGMPGVSVEVAAHPKYGALATVRASEPLASAAEAALRELLGRFQIRTEVVGPE
ncbi:MAG TPA: acyl-CoA synthetase [Roseiarcus sp.]|nr:acyl-CoA synthetase [Roseiarcus sp.]